MNTFFDFYLFQPTVNAGMGNGKDRLREELVYTSPPRTSPAKLPPSSGDDRGPTPYDMCQRPTSQNIHKTYFEIKSS